MNRRPHTLIATLAVVMVVLGGGAANAAWNISGSGSGLAGAGSLVTPSPTATRSATSPSSAIDLSWNASGQLPGVTYEVKRNGTTTLTCTTSPCTDSGLTANTSYSYVVTAKLGGWSKDSTAATASTGSAATPASGYVLSASPNSITAGSTTTVTITAKDANGNIDANYTGTKTVAWTGSAFAISPGGVAPSAATSVTFTDGVSAGVPVTLTSAGSGLALTATNGSLSGSTTVSVSPGAPSRLAMTATSYTGDKLSSSVASSPCTVFACTRSGLGNNGSVTTKVSVTDSFGNVVSNIGGGGITVNLSKSALTGTLSGTSLTIPGSGAATSSQTVTLTEGTANYNNTLTATSQAPANYTSAATTIQK